MSTIKFNFSSTNSISDKSGSIKSNGFNSYALVPVGSVATFTDRFNDHIANDNTISTLIASNLEVQADVDTIYGRIPSEYFTATNLAEHYVDIGNGIYNSSAITQWTGAYASKEHASSIVSLLATAEVWDDANQRMTRVASGFATGVSLDSTGEAVSFFDIAADNFRIFGSITAWNVDTGAWEPTGEEGTSSTDSGSGRTPPIFMVRQTLNEDNDVVNSIYLNGRVEFSNLSNSNGVTIIDGGLIDTDTINVANKIVIGATTASRHLGSFPQWWDMSTNPDTKVTEAEATNPKVVSFITPGEYTTYDGQDTYDWVDVDHPFQGVVFRDGDTYFNRATGTNFVWDESLDDWSSSIGVEGNAIFSKSIFIEGAKDTTPSKPTPPNNGSFSSITGNFTPPTGGWTEDKPFVTDLLNTVYESISVWERSTLTGEYSLSVAWGVPVDVGGFSPIKGTDYFDGTGSFTDYAFASVSTTPTTITSSGSDAFPEIDYGSPQVWFDDIEELLADQPTLSLDDDQIYVSKGIHKKLTNEEWALEVAYTTPTAWNGTNGTSPTVTDNGDGTYTVTDADGTVISIVDGTSTFIEYSVTGATGTWHEGYTLGDIYIRTGTKAPGATVTTWGTGTRFVPQEGADYWLADGRYVEVAYSTSSVTPVETGSFNGTTFTYPTTGGWQDTPPSVSDGSTKIYMTKSTWVNTKPGGVSTWTILPIAGSAGWSVPRQWNGLVGTRGSLNAKRTIRRYGTLSEYTKDETFEAGTAVTHYGTNDGLPITPYTHSQGGAENLHHFVSDVIALDGDGTVTKGDTVICEFYNSHLATGVLGTTEVIYTGVYRSNVHDSDAGDFSYNVRLHVHGDAIIDGTLKTSRLVADTIDGLVISGSHGYFDDQVGGYSLVVAGGFQTRNQADTASVMICGDSGISVAGAISATGITATNNVHSNGTMTAGLGMTAGTSTSSTVAGTFTSNSDAQTLYVKNYLASSGATRAAYFAGNAENATGTAAVVKIVGNSTGFCLHVDKNSTNTAKPAVYVNVDTANSPAIATNGTISAFSGVLSFTGAHYILSSDFSGITGDILNVIDVLPVSVNQSYPITAVCTTSLNKKVIGVLSDALFQTLDDVSSIAPDLYYSTIVAEEYTDEDGKFHEKVENFLLKPEYQEIYDNLVLEGNKFSTVNSLGEGGVNACSINGDIENGDYICSSIVPGKGMKQDDDLLHNYTVAKALSDIIWNDYTIGVGDCYGTIGSDGIEYKTLMIPCTYHCG